MLDIERGIPDVLFEKILTHLKRGDIPAMLGYILSDAQILKVCKEVQKQLDRCYINEQYKEMKGFIYVLWHVLRMKH